MVWAKPCPGFVNIANAASTKKQRCLLIPENSNYFEGTYALIIITAKIFILAYSFNAFARKVFSTREDLFWYNSAGFFTKARITFGSFLVCVLA
jgi:hypothetical protein